MSDRARGALLYAGAAVLLGAGTFWWFGAAPGEPRDPMIEQWRARAVRLLPDVESQNDGGMVTLTAGAEHEVLSDVGTGEFLVSVVCVGAADSLVRISLGDFGDSGRGMPCADHRTPDNFTVAVADQLRMNVSVSDAGPVVFRYSVLRADD